MIEHLPRGRGRLSAAPFCLSREIDTVVGRLSAKSRSKRKEFNCVFFVFFSLFPRRDYTKHCCFLFAKKNGSFFLLLFLPVVVVLRERRVKKKMYVKK